jgi:hypothetical protein
MKTSFSYPGKWARVIICLPLLFLMVLFRGSASAEDYAKLRAELRDSAQAIESGDYEKAFDIARDAYNLTSEKADAALLEGMALNRLGRYDEALAIMGPAVSPNHPEFVFEIGWAFVGAGQYQKGIDLLKRYDAAYPGRGMTSLLIAEGYLRLHEKAKAAHYFQVAEQRDPALKPSAERMLASGGGSGGRSQGGGGGGNGGGSSQQPWPQSPSRWFWQGTGSQKSWQVAVSVAGGYDSNVVAQGNGAPLPTGISHQDGGFFYSAVEGHNDFTFSPDDRLRLGYAFQSRTYDGGLGGFNYLDNYLTANYFHVFNQKWEVSLLTGGEFTYIGGNYYNTEPSVRPTLTYKETSWAATDLAYCYAHNSYNTTTGPVIGRRGSTNSILAQQRVQVPDTKLELRAGYSHGWTYSAGTDYDYQSNTVFFGLIYQLPYDTQLQFYYDHEWDAYSHINSLSFTFPPVNRYDDINSLNLYLAHPVTKCLDVFVRYNFNGDDSNISFFKYNDSIVMAGVTAHF